DGIRDDLVTGVQTCALPILAAVMGAFLVTYPRDRIRVLLVIFFFVRVTLIPGALLIGVWFLIQLFNAGSVATVQTGGIAYLAHVGGFIFGAVFGRLFVDPDRIAQSRGRLSARECCFARPASRRAPAPGR